MGVLTWRRLSPHGVSEVQNSSNVLSRRDNISGLCACGLLDDSKIAGVVQLHSMLSVIT